MTRLAFLEGEENQRRSFWIGAAFLLFLALCMFSDVLFTGRAVVLSDGRNDLASQFIYSRAFAADQLRQGRMPLWNPHVFCGMPFFGAAEVGVLYPSSWLDLALTLPRSINWGIAFHVFLAGLLTYVWGLRRGLHPVAAVVAGALFMFSGVVFLHVYAGHVTLLCAIAWTPLVFLSIDGWLRTQMKGWVLLGMAAITMQIFADQMLVFFQTAVAAGLFTALGLIKAQRRLKTLLGFLIMYAGAAALGSVQLLTTMQAASESVRGGGVSYDFAAMVSFPPENILTLLTPGFFGNMTALPYWGRWYWWETCMFISVAGLVLAAYGAIYGNRENRRGLMLLTLILLILALGSNTPLFHFLYHVMPGFNRVRSNAKFIMEASLFMVMLTGVGLDQLLRIPEKKKWFVLACLAASIFAGGAAIELRRTAQASGSPTWWSRAMSTVYNTHETYLSETDYTNEASVRQAGEFASNGLFVAAAELLILSGLVFLSRFSRKWVYAIGLMAIVEVFIFGRLSLTTFDLSSTEAPRLKAFLNQRPGDYRIFYQGNPNIAMWLDKEDVWGYTSLVPKRYAEFMAFTQRQPPERATQYLDFLQFHPLHAMLRWRYAFLPTERGDRILTAPAIMPRLQLINEYRVIKNRDEILQFMGSPSFDPRQQVILETKPNPAPVPSEKEGTVQVISLSASQMIIDADLSQPSILLITDLYSKGWRARPLEGSVQHAYHVLPANYVLRAIPLSKGHHRIRLEYLPVAFQAGAWISVVSIISFAFVTGYQIRKNRARLALS